MADEASKSRGMISHRGIPEAIVVLAVFAAYAGCGGGPWILDDVPLIQRNPLVRNSYMWGHLFTSDYWNITGANLGLYRPLPLLSYGLTWALVGDSTWLFHITNIALHAANALLMWRVGMRGTRTWTALVCTMLFALHPIHAEAVANVAGRPELIVGFGVLLAMWAAAYTVTTHVRSRRVGWTVVLLVGALVALFSKEHATLILGWIAVSGAALVFARRDSNVRARLAVAAPVVAAIGVYLAMRFYAVSALPTGGGEMAASERFRLSATAAAKAFQLLIFPIEQRAIWDLAEASRASVGWLAAGCMVIAVAIGFGAASPFSRMRWVMALGLMFVAAAPLFHPLPNLIWVWERGLYVPCIGFVWAVYYVVERGRLARTWIVTAVGLVALAAGVQTARLAWSYGDSLRFWQKQYGGAEGNVTVAINYSQELIAAKRFDEAVKVREQAYRREPQNGLLVSALANAYLQAKREPDARMLLSQAAGVKLSFKKGTAAAPTLRMLAMMAARVGAEDAATSFSVLARADDTRKP